MNFKAAKTRSRIYHGIRDFFDTRGFLEVETPLFSSHLIPEASLESFSTSLVSPYKKAVPLYLLPSPELYMKEMLARGSGDIYQICKCFRNSEQVSKIHNPEFTMLEWYKTGITADENIEICCDLVRELLDPESPDFCKPPFRRMTVEEAFWKFAGFSLEGNMEEGALREQLDKAGIPFSSTDDWESLYHRLFLTLVEPQLPSDRPLVLSDYPSRIPTLAKKKEGTAWDERWELYINGMEIANCYGEETQRARIEDYYAREIPKKEKNAILPGVFSPDWPRLISGLPPCSGTAVGLDRLIAALMGYRSIQGVILFPIDAILPP